MIENGSVTFAHSSDRPSSSMGPQSLGRYRILNEVGRGATAFVYKAYDPQLDRFLAIKVLREDLASDQDYREAFLKEARLAAQLTHPGIVTIFDVGVAENKPYIAMELLDGATLEQILSSQGKLNPKTVLAMALQLSKALSYAHQQGVVHRDIKPGNIVVLKDKKTVKLTDFGIAQVDDTLGKVGKNSDKVLGTPEYMAPEQVLGRPMDSRSDLYSFGVLLFRMIMGVSPFISDDLGELFKQIIKHKPPMVIVNEESIKDDLHDLIRKLLQKQPHKRFKNATILTSELRRIQNKLLDKQKAARKEFISLRLKWTASMAGLVFVAMCIGLTIVYFMQYRALSGITFDYGRSITMMLAFDSSEPMLLDDNVGLNALVRDISNNEQLRSVYVMDNNNQILASTDTAVVGQQFVPPDKRQLMQSANAVEIYKRELATNQVLFDIAAPVQYGDKPLGQIYVSFSGDSMYTASKTTLITMLAVMMITLVVVFMVTLVLARRAAKDFERITQALNKLSMGRVDARLISDRNDEVGHVFSAFNQLAKFLEHRFESRKNSTLINQASIDSITKKQRMGDNPLSESDTLNHQNLEETVELDIVTQKK